jgi:prefoldin alpha subunit
MEERKKLESMVNEINMYQSQADALNQQMETVKSTIADLNIASETLETIKDEKDTETLVPIGAGSFIITEIKNTDDVIVGLGAGVAVKRTIDSAKDSIKDQKKDLEALLNKMMADLNKITEIIVRKTPEAEALIQKLEGTEQ